MPITSDNTILPMQPVNPIFMLPEIQDIAKDLEWDILYSPKEENVSARSLANEYIGRIVQAVESTVAAKLISEPITADWLNKNHGGVLSVGEGCEIVPAGTMDALRGAFARLEYQRESE